MKVYVITKGRYSDYRICAVADNEERAELLRKYFSDGWDEARIEIYDTEEITVVGSPKRIYNIYIGENGTVSEGREEWYFKDEPFRNVFDLRGNEFRASIATDDYDKAVKIARDERAKMFAERLGL